MYLNFYNDDSGEITVIENIPFAVKRAYYIDNILSSSRRGFHAHKKTQQVVVAPRGECTFLLDNGREKTEYKLDNPRRGIFVDKMIWHEFYGFGDGCLLLVLASLPFDETDYIRDYRRFLSAAATDKD